MSNKNQVLKFGLIGTGKMASVHAENISASTDAEIIVVGSGDLKRGVAFAKKHGIPTAVGTYEETLNHDIDAVFIVSTSDSHTDLITKAAEHKVHIFCEKPIGDDLSEIDKALVAVKHSGVTLQVGFNRRFDPHFNSVREIAIGGKVGKVEQIIIVSRDPQAPSPENLNAPYALLSETTSHDLHMAYILGGAVKTVTVLGSVLINPKFIANKQIDTATVTLRFESGAQGVIQNSWRSAFGYDQRLEVHCSNETLHVDNVKPEESKTGTATSSQHKGATFFLERYYDSYRLEMESFIDCIRNNTKPLVTGDDARYVAALVEAAKQSVQKEGYPVAVSDFL